MSETEKLVRVDHQPLVVPLDLWLQWHGDGTPEDDGEVCESEVTWSRRKDHGSNLEELLPAMAWIGSWNPIGAPRGNCEVGI